MLVKELKELFGWVSTNVIQQIEIVEVSGEKKVCYLEDYRFPYCKSAWEFFLEDSTFDNNKLSEVGPVELVHKIDDFPLNLIRIFLD